MKILKKNLLLPALTYFKSIKYNICQIGENKLNWTNYSLHYKLDS